MTSEPVAIYSTPTCHFCGMTKEFFKANNVEYVEHDVASDVEKRKEMIEKSGQMGVPVITIGENVIVGYDEEELRRLLNV
jgi:glutaredoxin 3